MAKPEAEKTDGGQELFTIMDLARKVGLTYRTIHRNVRLGKIRVVRCAGSVRIPKDEVERILARGF